MTAYPRRSAATRTAVTAMALTIALAPFQASAQPQDGTSDAMERYQELGAQAADAEEDLSEAEDGLARRQQALDEANAALAKANRALRQAQDAEAAFRDEADNLAAASLRNGRIARWSAILTNESSQEFLDKMSALGVLANNNAETLSRLSGIRDRADAARAEAAQARQRARAATAEAERAVRAIEERKAKLDAQIEQVRSALDDLSSTERATLGTVQDTGSYLGPPGAANDALQAALSRRGSEYEWGATGPNEFDCSGLTSWSYAQAGITIPRTSRQQWGAGKPVSLDALLPGDLLFYDDGTGDPSAIHHVGMYVGEGKMVDAPTEGQLVDVRSMEGDGHLSGARRIVG
ncbi:cell wall-associated NlpC family hydrolase [Saccharomonospora amisosensis]|uniref:Cell wall-associated NlpC family hydrolase n=1 Tax=Saccharomonospora amisosensis TaxID=1128677 RepID=A0A7X5UR37_9PSEU|nr:NlpC/P60 family protein [Saccharomonospora amisosensis]NIJ12600.1 cell wall-associated NlpC family hydrolase [Saccharomonospora amisosensis]